MWRQNWVACVTQIARRVSLGRTEQSCYSEQMCCSSSIDPRIIELSIRRGQNNFRIVSSFVSWEEKDFYRVVSVGQLGFDSRSYCGRSHRMQRWTCNLIFWSDLRKLHEQVNKRLFSILGVVGSCRQVYCFKNSNLTIDHDRNQKNRT
jgi:hypothetical protein